MIIAYMKELFRIAYIFILKLKIAYMCNHIYVFINQMDICFRWCHL